jgi:NAD(P)-dependent dehydrogenase (short-subunit alcohol dehydrogenase family)
LITSGTAGIGLAVVPLMAGGRCRGRRLWQGPRTRRKGGQRGRPNHPLRTGDLADLDSVKELALQSGDVDIIVNNAASFPAALTVEQDVASFETTFNTNVRVAYFLLPSWCPACSNAGAAGSGRITDPHLGRRIRITGRACQQCRRRLISHAAGCELVDGDGLLRPRRADRVGCR